MITLTEITVLVTCQEECRAGGLLVLSLKDLIFLFRSSPFSARLASELYNAVYSSSFCGAFPDLVVQELKLKYSQLRREMCADTICPYQNSAINAADVYLFYSAQTL